MHASGVPPADASGSSHEAVDELLGLVEDYPSTIPDELVAYYLNKTGFSCADARVNRLIAVATQKFITDVASEALNNARLQVAKSSKKDKSQSKTVTLTTEELSTAVAHHGVTFKKPRFYADGADAVTEGLRVDRKS